MSDYANEAKYTVKDVARILNFSPATVYAWRRRGWITVVRTPTGGLRIPKSELDRILHTGVKPIKPS